MTAPQISADVVGYHFVEKTVAPENKATKREIKYNIRVKQFDETPEGFSATLAELGGENGVVGLINVMYDARASSAGTAPVRNAKAEADMDLAIAAGIKAAYEYVYRERGPGQSAIAKAVRETAMNVRAGKIDLNDLEAVRATLSAILGL